VSQECSGGYPIPRESDRVPRRRATWCLSIGTTSLRSTSYRVHIKKNAPGNPELRDIIVNDGEGTVTDYRIRHQIIVTVTGRNSKAGGSAETAPVNGTVP
jgi:hypothetical protein